MMLRNLAIVAAICVSSTHGFAFSRPVSDVGIAAAARSNWHIVL